jgi:hypothetical protein
VGHYKSNVRDQVFNLFEVFEIDKALGTGDFTDLDRDTAEEMLGEFARLCAGPIGDSFVEGDRNPPVFDYPTIRELAEHLVSQLPEAETTADPGAHPAGDAPTGD